MIRVHIDNSLSKVESLSVPEFKALREVLSYSLPASAAFFSGRGPTKKYLLDRRSVFPTGLLPIVRKHFESSHTAVEWIDKRKCPPARDGLFTLNLEHKPYLEQVAAVEAASVAHRGTISAVTGFGKSVTMALLIDRLQVPTLVVVPNLELRRQLIDSFRRWFGNASVGGLYGQHWCPIAVENVDALKLGRPVTGYDCLIIDEAHHVAASTYRKLNARCWNDIYHRYFFTATPFRAREEEQILMESVSGLVIYRVDYKTAVAKRYIVPLEAYYVDAIRTKAKGNTWASVYSELVVKNTARNELIASLLTRLHRQGVSTLALVKEVAHGSALSSLTGAGFAHGQAEDCRELIAGFSAGQLKTLIGTTGVLGEGVDTRPAEFVIIAGLGKSRNQFMQQVGRTFRRYPGKESAKVILIRDESHRWTRDHFKEQVRFLREEYGIEPTRLEL